MNKYLQSICPVCHKDSDPVLNRALKTSLRSKVYNPSIGMTNEEWEYYSTEPPTETRRRLEAMLQTFHKEQEVAPQEETEE